MDKKRKGLSLFQKGMIIYVVAFIIIAAAALVLLYNFIGVYEVSGSKSCLNGYMDNLKQGIVPAVFEQELEQLDESIQSREDNLKWLSELVSEAGYARVPSENGAEYEDYAIVSRGVEIGRIRLAPMGVEKFGLEFWKVEDESYDLSSFIKSESFFLPENYTLQVGDASISAGTEKREYEVLDYVYKRYDNLPYMHNFDSGSYIGDVDVVIKDDKGNVLSEDQLTEQYFLNNCDDELKARLEEFGKGFAYSYVNYGSNNGGAVYANFGKLHEIMDHNSEVYERVMSVWGGIFYTYTEYCNILSLDVNICSELADNLYLIDVSYTTETKGYADPVITDNYARIVAYETDYGQLLATNMYNY